MLLLWWADGPVEALSSRGYFVLSVAVSAMTWHRGVGLREVLFVNYVLFLYRWSLCSWKTEPAEEWSVTLLDNLLLFDHHVVDFLEAKDAIAQEQSDEEANQPADPNVSPMVLVPIDPGEGVNDRQSNEAENEERTEEWSSAQVNHIVDVERCKESTVRGESCVKRGKREPSVPQLLRPSEVARQRR